MRYQLYKWFNWSAGKIPAPALKNMLRALHRHPEFARRVGYHVYPLNYCNPFPDPTQVDAEKLKLKRTLPGVRVSVPEALALLQELSRFSAEVKQFLQNRAAKLKYWEMTYPSVDSGTLYAMLRHLKPKRYIEVGCGYSSRASVAALSANATEGSNCECIFIEPYPPPYLAEMKLPGRLIEKKIEQVPVEQFQQLEAGDVLFIDTSHVIKVQNDVEYELLHILPSLKAGVYVHIHDIFTPYDYPAEWLIGSGTNLGGNNEQYALECLLSGGDDWEVILPVHMLWREYKQQLEALFYNENRPAAFWIRKKSPPKS